MRKSVSELGKTWKGNKSQQRLKKRQITLLLLLSKKHRTGSEVSGADYTLTRPEHNAMEVYGESSNRGEKT
jgi:hypothetical protein